MRIRKHLVALLAMFLYGYVSIAQELPQVIPPSPTVANLMAFEEVPIDYYSGQPNIAISLYNKQVNTTASLSLALRYSTQGIKIDSRSSWVGTGWSLETGGVISRTVRGIPDDKQDDSYNTIGVLHNPDFWNYDALTVSDKAEFLWRSNGTGGDRYDTQLDMYQFSLLGASGRFVIVKENGSLVPKLLNKNQNVKIILDENTTTLAINTFTIIDAYGYKYFFEKKETTKATPVSASQLQTQGSQVTISASGASAIYDYVSAWHLSRIETSNGIELAKFTYSPSTENYVVSRTTTENRIKSVSVSSLPDFLANAYNGSQLKPVRVVSYFVTETISQKPLKITFKDGASVNFVTAAGTHPETGGKILDHILIKDKAGVEQKRFTLATTETTSNDRLWLTGVTEIAAGISLSHILNYESKADLPAFGALSDTWGYHTSMSTSGLPLAFDPDLINTGLLTSIDFPTGGRKEFVFENNSFTHGAGNELTTDQYWENPDNYTLEKDTRSFSGDYDLGSSSGLFNTSLLTLDFDQTVYLEVDLQGALAVGPIGGGTDPYLGQTQTDGQAFDPVNNMILKIEDAQSNQLALIPIRNTAFVTTVALPAGTNHSVTLISPTTGTWALSGAIKLHYKDGTSTSSKYLYGGGVRVKAVNFYADPQSSNADRAWEYSYQDPIDPAKSSGAVDALLSNLRQEYEVDSEKHLFNGSENIGLGFAARSVTYQVTSQGPNAQITKGGYVGYKTVKVAEPGNGETVFTYTNAQDYPSPAGVFTYPFDPAPNLDYKRGLLLNQQVKTEGGLLLKETINTHEFDLLEGVVAISRKLINPENCEWLQFYGSYATFQSKIPETELVPQCGDPSLPCITSFENCAPNPVFEFKNDNVVTNWARVTQTISKDYTYDGLTQFESVVRQTYSYNTNNFQQREVNRYIKENGQEVAYKTELFYPVGSALPTGLYSTAESNVIAAKMNALNDINTVVLTRSYKGSTLLNTVANVFEEFSTNLVKLKEVKTFLGTNTPESRMVVHDYDTHGNILEVSKTGDSHIVYLWGYDQTLPVAMIQNATYNQIESLSGFGTDFHAGSGGLTPAQEAALRTLPYTQVTTMTYDRTFGMTSQTSPNGMTTYYEYDSMGRLKYIKDREGNILKANEYKYQTTLSTTGN